MSKNKNKEHNIVLSDNAFIKILNWLIIINNLVIQLINNIVINLLKCNLITHLHNSIVFSVIVSCHDSIVIN